MLELFSQAREIQDFLNAKNWPFCFIGGLALQAWGEVRVTQDIDLSLFTGFGEEDRFVDSLLKKYSGRIQGTREFALANRVLLLKSESGIGIDIALAGMPFEEEVITRAVDYLFSKEISLKICCASDLVVLKAFAARPKDWTDIDGILVRQGKKLNKDELVARLEPLAQLKEEPELVVELIKRFDKFK